MQYNQRNKPQPNRPSHNSHPQSANAPGGCAPPPAPRAPAAPPSSGSPGRASVVCVCGGHGIGPSQKPAIYACICIRSEISQSIDRSVSRSDGPQARPARPGPICWWPPPPHTADHYPGPQPGPIEPHISKRACLSFPLPPAWPACLPPRTDRPTDGPIDRSTRTRARTCSQVSRAVRTELPFSAVAAPASASATRLVVRVRRMVPGVSR